GLSADGPRWWTSRGRNDRSGQSADSPPCLSCPSELALPLKRSRLSFITSLPQRQPWRYVPFGRWRKGKNKMGTSNSLDQEASRGRLLLVFDPLAYLHAACNPLDLFAEI